MKLLFEKKRLLPNGVEVNHHQLVRVEASPTMEEVEVRVVSWPTEQARLEGTEPVWMWHMVLQAAALELQLGWPMCVVGALRQRDEFLGATMVGDAAETPAAAVARARAAIKAERDTAEQQPVDVPGVGQIDADLAAQRRLANAVLVVALGQIEWLRSCVESLAIAAKTTLPRERDVDEDWTLADNSVKPVTGADLMRMHEVVSLQVSQAHARARLALADVAASSDATPGQETVDQVGQSES